MIFIVIKNNLFFSNFFRYFQFYFSKNHVTILLKSSILSFVSSKQCDKFSQNHVTTLLQCLILSFTSSKTMSKSFNSNSEKFIFCAILLRCSVLNFVSLQKSFQKYSLITKTNFSKFLKNT